jgi:hypothetical protein
MPFTFSIESFEFAIELSIYSRCVNDCPRIVRCRYLVAFGVFFSEIFHFIHPDYRAQHMHNLILQFRGPRDIKNEADICSELSGYRNEVKV